MPSPADTFANSRERSVSASESATARLYRARSTAAVSTCTELEVESPELPSQWATWRGVRASDQT